MDFTFGFSSEKSLTYNRSTGRGGSFEKGVSNKLSKSMMLGVILSELVVTFPDSMNHSFTIE